jgi:uncharacterized membrane protein YbhN (UPF0104 family)
MPGFTLPLCAMKALAVRIYHSLRSEKGSNSPWWMRALQLLITLAVLLYVYQRLRAEEELWVADFWLRSWENWTLLGLAVLLMPVNLGLEAGKWFRMVRQLYPALRFQTIYQAVFTGLATGIFTPNRVGEYAGRVMSLPAGKRVEAATYTLVDRVLQMIITLWMGLLGLGYLLWFQGEELASVISLGTVGANVLLIALSTLNVLLLSAWLMPHRWIGLLRLDRSQHAFLNKVGQAVLQLESRTLREVLALGIMRYLVFSSQFLLLLYGLGYGGTPILALALVSLVFLAKSLVPSIALTELGVRESIALLVMGAFRISAFTVVSSTFLLFLVNVITPALIGLVFVYRIRL